MTDPVVTKMFRNGGSWAIRIPAALVPASEMVDIRRTAEGVIEIRPHNAPPTVDDLLGRWSTEPPPSDAHEPWPARPALPHRFSPLDSDESA